MQLISILGATESKHHHTYYYNNKEYHGRITLEALLSINKYDRVVIFVTIEAEYKQILIIEELSKKYNIQKVHIPSNEFDEIIEAVDKQINEDTVLDLTQGFRHIPMLALIASIQKKLSKINYGISIIYAKTLEPDKIPSQESVKFEFINLSNYLDIAYVTTILEIFLSSYNIIEQYNIENENLKNLVLNLRKFSAAIIKGNLYQSIQEASKIKEIISKIKTELKISKYIKGHLGKLEDEMSIYEKMGKLTIIEKLYEFSRIMFVKNNYGLVVESLKECMNELFVEYYLLTSSKFKTMYKAQTKNEQYQLKTEIYRFIEIGKAKDKVLEEMLSNKELPKYDSKKLQNFLTKLRNSRNTIAHIAIDKEDSDKLVQYLSKNDEIVYLLETAKETIEAYK
ncbi:MAG: TM1812 family CRISPR-associated protein [Candidatus Margulisbacteria bacterium]|nr:TM1812 family CRISPR-associated protein [Candidatus Margulisiibacteriota bacterium]